MTQRRFLILLLAVATVLAAPAIAGVPVVTLELVPSTTFVPPGGSVDIDVVISGLDNLASLSLGAFDLDLQFDPAVFAFNSVAFALELGDPGAAEAITTVTPGAGTINVTEVSLLLPATLNGAQPDTFTLLTATFDATSPGSGAFDILSPLLGDELGNPLTLGGVIPVTVDTGSVLDIPTLGPWGVLLMSLLLLAAGSVALRRMS